MVIKAAENNDGEQKDKEFKTKTRERCRHRATRSLRKTMNYLTLNIWFNLLCLY